MLKIQKDQDKENIRPVTTHVAIKLEENERKTRSGKESVKGSTFKVSNGLSTIEEIKQ